MSLTKDDYLLPKPAKPVEDVADWHIRMKTGETFEVKGGIVRYSENVVSIRAPKELADALLFISPTDNIDRIKRLTPRAQSQEAA